jgi:hypothetical protein
MLEISKKKIFGDDHVLCHLGAREINKNEFQLFCKIAPCIGETAFLVAYEPPMKTFFFIKMYLRKILHPISKGYDHLDKFYISKNKNGNMSFFTF